MARVSEPRQQVLDLVRTLGYVRRDEPFRLASGQLSHDYVDGKRAIASGANLRLVAETIIGSVREPFDAVGGLTMGADPLAHAVAVVSGCAWFAVRKQPKGRGTNQWIEGCELGTGVRVLLVDDVVSTGGSALQAYERVTETGAEVVAAATLVDRGDVAAAEFRTRRVPYFPLVTYRDLGIEPIGPAMAAAGH